jgi:CheY-like chemotaxis protein
MITKLITCEGLSRKDGVMLKLLLVTPDTSGFVDFAREMTETGRFEILWAGNGSTALNMLAGAPVDLVVADESLGDMSGLAFAEKLVSLNPMINCALVSSRPADEFHEISEGLGILAQLTPNPDPKQAIDLIRHLENIFSLSSNIKDR